MKPQAVRLAIFTTRLQKKHKLELGLDKFSVQTCVVSLHCDYCVVHTNILY